MELDQLERVTYSPELLKQLTLSEEQLHALNAERFEGMLFEKVAQIIGVSADDAQAWQSNPFFCVCWHIREDVNNWLECLEGVQAGFLASLGLLYPEIEDILELERLTLRQWSSADDDESGTDTAIGVAFRAAESALQRMKRDAMLYGDGVSEKQRVAVPHILAGKTDKEVGDLVGVRRETILAWKRNPDFKRVLEAERKRLVAVNRERLASLFEKACYRACQLMDSDDEKISARVTLGVLSTLRDVALPVEPKESLAEDIQAMADLLSLQKP